MARHLAGLVFICNYFILNRPLSFIKTELYFNIRHMIDTIVLLLNKDFFTITQPDKFRLSATWVLSERYPPNRVLQSKQNPTKKKFLKGVYKSRLTLALRPNILGVYEPTLKVELSLPKLLFGNNFHELRYKDFVLWSTSL